MLSYTNEAHTFCGYIPVCSGGGVTVEGCGVGGVSGEVESEITERGGDGSTEYGSDAIMGDGKYEGGTRMGASVTCDCTVVGVAVLVVSDGGGDTNGMETR